MKTIWKFTLDITDLQDVAMPEGAEILTVQTQRNKICIWAVVDPEARIICRRFRIAGTGHAIDGRNGYIGTTMTDGSDFVWHVFEVTP